MKKLSLFLYVLVSVNVTSPASSDTITFMESVSLTPLDWSAELFLPSFDSDLGT
jgi:hypothetical protein